jgi:glycerol-3-phosphate dehydrogenase
VVLNALDAAEHGATVLTGWRCTDAQRNATGWQMQLQDANGARRQVSARALVNAAGPWAAQFLQEHAHLRESKTLRLVKGSHIVVKRLFDHDHAYIFQNPDRRIIFAIPYEGEFTLIGTTDVEHRGAIGRRRIDAARSPTCASRRAAISPAVTPADVVWTYSGVRPLLDDERGDPSAVTRDYMLDSTRTTRRCCPVWGGKITTFRKLAEEAADLLASRSACDAGAWTAAPTCPAATCRAWIGAPQRPDTDFAASSRRSRAPPAAGRPCVNASRALRSRVERLLGATASAKRSRPAVRGRLNYLQSHRRMGAQRGRRAVAPHQARPAPDAATGARRDGASW